MKKVVKFLLIISPILFSSFECSDSVTNPTEYPEGYQFDIPWPSLADSPWPTFHGNMQSTGRSKYLGPQNGLIIDTIFVTNVQGGVVIGNDSTIYFTTNMPGNIYAVDLNTQLKWKVELGYSNESTPLVSSDGTIYCIQKEPGKLIALNNSGSIKWEYAAETPQGIGIAIGLDGTIYFISSPYNLNAVGKNGTLLWSLSDYRFGSSLDKALTFSPDGKTIYSPGYSKSVLAIDIVNKIVKWTFGDSRLQFSPIVDCKGNVYLLPDNDNQGKYYLYSLHPDGMLRWKFEYSWSSPLIGYIDPTIDANGNVYFGTDTLYSVDYYGNLRWKTPIPENSIIGSPVICDKEGNIYLITFNSASNNKVFCFSGEGIIKWSLNLPQDVNLPGASAAISNNGLMFIPSWSGKNIYVIK
jgi:outer membrane protein assembly factor BamB